MQIKKTRDKISLRYSLQLLASLLVIALLLFFNNNTNTKTHSDSLVQSNSNYPTLQQLDTITIEISREHFLQLEQKRNESIGKGDIAPEAGILLTSDDDLVKARIRYKAENLKGEIRLKGDWTEHLLGDTWSFRVKLDGDASIKGMRKFSLQHPKTRNYAGEWLFHELLRQENILHLRYDFVNVVLKITGDLQEVTKVLGVYALEEFFDKRLIEHNRRREGILLKFDEDPIWKERKEIMTQHISLSDLNYFKLTELQNLDILPFEQNKVLTDSVLNKQFRTAKYLLRSFVEQKLPISEVFDVEKLAMFNAICNILGSNHALFHHNYRLYYNPVNSRLEPVGFDANAIQKVFFFYPYLHAYEDEAYSRAYMAALEKVSSDAYFEAFLQSPQLKAIVEMLHEVYPEYVFHEDYLRSNKAVIRSLLFPVKSLNVFLESTSNNSVTLSIFNHGRYPAEIIGLSNLGNRSFGAPTENVFIPPGQKKIVSFGLDEHHAFLFIKKKKEQTAFNLSANLDQIQLDYKTAGTRPVLHATILPWSDSDESIRKTDVFRQASNVDRYPFLITDSLAKTITCPRGAWQVSHLVIPKGFTFIVEAGASIHLNTPFGNILSFSPVRFLGKQDAPITVYTYEDAKGLLVLNCKDTSIVQHTTFDNLSAAFSEGWSVSGAVNFYDAPVKFFNCAITNNRSEDALNIINTYFEIDNLVFQNTQADAFDGDFVKGTIRNSLFNAIGNDAIDVSGSDIYISNIHISGAGDKALSAGEKSTFVADHVVIKDSEIAVACKDQSTLHISNALLENNKLAFTAFQKKAEFGPASIAADSVDLKNNTILHLIEHKSKLLINEKEVKTEAKVLERMYGIEFGKKSN